MADDLAAAAAAVLDHNSYLTLATVSPDGRPWATPAYFAADRLTDFYWVSATTSEHSRNLAAHPAVGLVVFDSTVGIGHARAVYAEGTAAPVPDEDLEGALTLYPGPRPLGGRPFARADLVPPSPHRLYRFTATSVWLLCPREPGQPCPLHGRADDHRARVR